MMDLEKLNGFLQARGILPKQLAQKANLPLSIVENILDGYTVPRTEQLQQIATALGVDCAYFEDGQPLWLMEGGRRVPFFQHPDDYTAPTEPRRIQEASLVPKEEAHAEFFAFVAPDDSMRGARILKGDTVIVKKQLFKDEGDIVLVHIGGKNELFRYSRNLNAEILIKEDGSGEAKPLVFDRAEPVQILGIVTKTMIHFK